MRRVLAALVAVTACASEPAGEPIVGRADRLEVPIGISAELDLLLVVDNSPQMANLTAKVAGDIRAMMTTVERRGELDGIPDLRVGVITTDLADDGALRGGDFLAEATRFPFEEVRSFSGDLADAVAPRADVGATGGAPRPFAALERALAGAELRPDAYLAIVILTATDDTGTEEAAALAQAIEATKRDPHMVIVNAATACAPGTSPRVEALLAQFPDRNSQLPICAEDLGPLAAFDALYKVSLGLPCLHAPPSEPRDCAASLVDPLTAAQMVLPACTEAAPDRCWSLTVPSLCPDGLPSVQLPLTTFPATAILECAID